MTDHGPLTIGDASAIMELIGAAQRNAPVAWVRFNTDGEPGGTGYGTARSIGTSSGGFIGRGEDVRDAYLRVTTREGLETFRPVAELMPMVHAGTFVVDYAAPTGGE